MYATQADLEQRFGADEVLQLTDRNSTGAVDVAVLSAAIGDAQAVIDGYLRSAGYTLPLATIPVELMRISCDLTRYFLYENSATQVVKDRRDEAVSWLRDVASGKVTLGVSMQGVAPDAAASAVRMTSDVRLFNAATLIGY